MFRPDPNVCCSQKSGKSEKESEELHFKKSTIQKGTEQIRQKVERANGLYDFRCQHKLERIQTESGDLNDQFAWKVTQVFFNGATYPYAIKNQRKARNAPSRGLWVP